LFLYPKISSASLPPPNESQELKKADDGNYHLQVAMSQWEIKIYNFDANTFTKDNFDRNRPLASSSENPSIGPFQTGSTVIFEIYSKDIQHGFSIPGLNVALATNRPDPGEAYGRAVSAEVVLPDEPEEFLIECHIFCGLGHPDEKIELLVGDQNDAELRLPFPILSFLFGLSMIFFLISSSRLKGIKTK
jgi:heme/copper-type cytochrome/quinol oxidase subunit 2